MQFRGVHTAGTSVPQGEPCLKSYSTISLAFWFLLLQPLITNPCKALDKCILMLSGMSVLTPGKHNSTPITACSGYNPANLTFTTPTSGGLPPYAYQWQLNNIAIPGETLPAYDPPQLTTAGSYSYNCAITDAGGTAVYTVAKIVTIVPDPVVTISGGGTVCLNNTVWLTSSILNGTGAYSCQWESGPAASGPWSPVPGAQSENYSPVTSMTGTVYYRLFVDPSTVSCNNTASPAVPVTVNPALVITVQPASQSDCKGNSVIFGSAISGGAPPIIYTWRRKKPGEPFFTNITADPDITYPAMGTMHVDKIGGANNPSGTHYQVVISDACGNSVTSLLPAILTVHEITGITPVTNNLQICDGQSLSYAVTTSIMPLSYQWLKDGVEIMNGEVYSGTTKDILTITHASPEENGIYQVRVVFNITTPNNNGGGATACYTTSTLDRNLIVNPLPATSTIYHN